MEQEDAEAVRFARDAAAALLCGKTGCNCETCRRVREGIHPDVQTLDREARDITVDDVRSLRRDAYVAPLEGTRKVYIILHAQNMNGAAQNAALKLFEEPPQGVYFILLCNNVQSLLQTVRSRCMILGGAAQDTDVAEDAEMTALAAQFASTAAKWDELALLEFCLQNEKLKRAQLSAFFAAVLMLLEQALRSAVGADHAEGAAGELSRLPVAQLVRLTECIRQRAALNERNVGAAHLMGSIPAELFIK